MTHESAIRRLLAEYCHHYDDQRPAQFAQLFTEEATFHVMGTTHHGRQDIHDHIGVQRPNLAPGQHVTYNSVIDVATDGERARAWTDFLYLRKADDGLRISTAGRYHDHLVREPDRWRFAARTIVFLGEPVPGDA